MDRILDSIHTPKDVKKLSYHELEMLANEVRVFLVENVSKTGGHLSSNLGVVELTIALHKCFDSPKDRILFDVGHQCYTHKLLTGRMDAFAKLRKEGGLSGFPTPRESEHDLVPVGHASTSLSTAVGLARAKKLKNEPGFVVAVIGDGAFTGGMAHEAINNMENLENLIVILNDNTMSISKNVGNLAHYFTHLRTSVTYKKAKNDVKNALDQTPVIGRGLKEGIRSAKNVIKRNIYHSTFFEEMGLEYIGPVDGHNLADLCNLFNSIRWTKDPRKPLLIHVETKKGKGFLPAEKNPGAYHGVSSFNIKKITEPGISPEDSYSTVFGQELASIADNNKSICAITAAMKYGTGLQYFKRAHRNRFFDVGLAESHAVTFAAGLATQGFLPVVAIYSTFLQRAYDQLIHDVMLPHLNVLFAIDRAGLVPGDGETHQGIYDAAFLSQQSAMPIVSPANYAELKYWLAKLLRSYTQPRAIRYPRGAETPFLAEKACTGEEYDVLIHHEGAEIAILSYGSEIEEAHKASLLLSASGILADVIQLVVINPIPDTLAGRLGAYKTLLFAEEGIRQGGIGEHLALEAYKAGFKGDFIHLATPETGIDHASIPQLRKQTGLDAQSIADRLVRGE